MVMNPRIKKLWIATLRSSDVVQGRNALAKIRRDGKLGMCCLGVACAMHNAEVKPKHNLWKQGQGQQFVYAGSENGIPGANVLKWMGLPKHIARDLAEKNDTGASFSQIANWIEKNL